MKIEKVQIVLIAPFDPFSCQKRR